jgi:hypothetical protein
MQQQMQNQQHGGVKQQTVTREVQQTQQTKK